MQKTGSIEDLKGILPKLGHVPTQAEIDRAIGEAVTLDDLRIRRQWRTLGPKRPKPPTNAAERTHIRAHEQWEQGNHRSAFRLMLAAATSGNWSAMTNLGYFYDLGIGVKKNRDAALKWYKNAYRHGDRCAANNIGTVYRFEGKTKRALGWFGRAVSLGDIDANLEIARVCIEDLRLDRAAIPYLKRVIGAKPRLEVTVSSREEAALLLKGIAKLTKTQRCGF